MGSYKGKQSVSGVSKRVALLAGTSLVLIATVSLPMFAADKIAPQTVTVVRSEASQRPVVAFSSHRQGVPSDLQLALQEKADSTPVDTPAASEPAPVVSAPQSKPQPVVKSSNQQKAPAPKAAPVQTARASAPEPPANQRPLDALFAYAKSLLGVPYVYGGTDPKTGLDCSAYVQWVFKSIGISLPRSTYGQINVGKAVGRDELQPGDLVFFSSSGPGPSHVGIYMGNQQMINATEPRVQISRIDTPGRIRTFYAARRILN